MKVEFIKNWHLKPLFEKALIENLEIEEDSKRLKTRRTRSVIFSSHSIPLTMLEETLTRCRFTRPLTASSRKQALLQDGLSGQRRKARVDWMGAFHWRAIERTRAGQVKRGHHRCRLDSRRPRGNALRHRHTVQRDAPSQGSLLFARTASVNANEKLMQAPAGMIC